MLSSGVMSERRGKWLLSLYPPLLFNRIRVLSFGPGYRSCRVRVARSLLTRNLNGTTFGGTIFSAADPFHALMYWQIFARKGVPIQVWMRRAQVDYRRPAATALTLEFHLTDEEIEQAEREIRAHGRHTTRHQVEAVDRRGTVCAVVEVEIYLRVPRADQQEVSAF